MMVVNSPLSSPMMLHQPKVATAHAVHRRAALRTTPLAHQLCTPCRLPSTWPRTPRHASARSTSAASAQAPQEETLRNDDLEWLKIDQETRTRVEDAVRALGNSTTVGDTAARAGITLPQAERALQALASDTHGVLQVSDRGDIVYSFPSDFQRRLLRRSLWLRTEPALKGAQRLAAYLSRIVFGTTLIASILLVYVTLVALMTASRSSNDRDDRYRSSPVFINTWGWGDMFWYWDPYYVRHRHRGHGRNGSSMNFMEGIFSFVFGDGDPNDDIAARRWQLVGQYIQSRGGVVAAEELAPYLQLDALVDEGDGSLYGDEAFMMPVCLRFGGAPVADEQGRVLYRFPSLQVTARTKNASPPSERALQEQPWQMTQADGLQVAASVGLGVMNFVGVVALTQVLQDPAARMVLAGSGLSFVAGLLPFLAAYAVAFFAIPAVRWVQNSMRNAGIRKRNAARMSYLQALANPSPGLQAKLRAARQLASTTQISERDVVFRTDRSAEEQARGSELAEFDRRLGNQDDWKTQALRRGQRTPER